MDEPAASPVEMPKPIAAKPFDPRDLETRAYRVAVVVLLSVIAYTLKTSTFDVDVQNTVGVSGPISVRGSVDVDNTVWVRSRD